MSSDDISTKEVVQAIAYDAINAVLDWEADPQLDFDLSISDRLLVKELSQELRGKVHEWAERFRDDD